MTTTQKPRKDREGPPEPKVRPIPKAAKTTMDIRDRDGKLRAALVGAGMNSGATVAMEPEPQTRTTRAPAFAGNNIPIGGEAERLEHEKQNRKFLPYANVHTLISETLNRDKNEWMGNHEWTRAAVGKAIGVLSEQSKNNPADDYTRAKYGLVKGFGELTQEKETLYDFEMWIIKKESAYERLSGAYSEMKMLSFAPYEQIVERCRGMIQTSEVARDYYVMVGITAGMNGAPAEGAIEMHDGLTGKSYSTVGELEKLRFDVWLQTRVPMGEEDVLREKEAALRRVGELLATLDKTKAEHEARSRDLNRAVSITAAELAQLEGERARVSRIYGNLEQADEAVETAEADKDIALAMAEEAENRAVAAEARAERTYRMLELVDEEADELDAVSEKRYELMVKQAESFDAYRKDMAKIVEDNQKLSRRVSEMESNITKLTAKLKGRDSGKLTPEDAARETEYSIPPEVAGAAAEGLVGEATAELAGDEEIEAALESVLGEAPEDLTDEAVSELSEERVLSDDVMAGLAELQEKSVVKQDLARAAEQQAEEDAAALVAAAEATVESEMPAMEITEELPLEDVEEIPAAAEEERRRFWKTLPGRVVDNIFVYGFKGEGEKRYPPKFEDFEGQENQQQKFLRADQAYKSWYGQTGRGVRNILEGTRKNWKTVTAVATTVAVLAAGTTGYFMYAPAQERAEQVALRELQKPTVTQVAVVDETAQEETGEVEKIEPKPEPLAKPALADVLAKHNLELEKGTNMANFYRGLNVEDIQEKYVILEGALGTDEQLQNYERKYSEKPILEMYADFLTTAMAYVQLAGQTDVERANARVAGERVAKRLQKLTQQKRIKEKLGKERAVEMNELAVQFQDSAEDLPSVEEVQTEEEKIVEVPVVTPEELEEMKKAGEEPELPVVILPDKTDEKPFKIEEEMGKVMTAEYETLDSASKVNEFDGKAGKEKKLKEKFLMQAHLSEQIVEHGMETKMSEKRILFMHIDTMNAAILFAMEDGQGMTAKAEALNAFDLANTEVKRILGYKKMKDERRKREKNITWLRNRAKELKNGIDNYNENKDKPIPLPGSPVLDNGNGVPTAMPETVKMDSRDLYTAMQTKTFSDHGLSIFEHPLKVREKMKGMKINSFDKFIIMEKLTDDVLSYPDKMGGLTKAEQFEMLRMLADFLDATRKAANEPKYWPADYDRSNIMLYSLAIDVAESIENVRKKKAKDFEPPKSRAHLYFPLDEGTFNALGAAWKLFDEQLRYEYTQKKRKNGNGNHVE
jgi:hypothetical protein